MVVCQSRPPKAACHELADFLTRRLRSGLLHAFALGGYQIAGEMIKLHEPAAAASQILKKSESNLVHTTLASSLSIGGLASEFLPSHVKAFATNLPFKHLAMVVAYHLCLKGKDESGAVEIADALWKEAESQRRHLLEMGDDVSGWRCTGQQNRIGRTAGGAAIGNRSRLSEVAHSATAAPAPFGANWPLPNGSRCSPFLARAGISALVHFMIEAMWCQG